MLCRTHNLAHQLVRRAVQSQLSSALPTLQVVPCRNTHIVQHHVPEKMQSPLPELAPDSQQRHKLADPRYIYQTVETNNSLKKRNLEVLLLKTVEGVGKQGTVVTMEAGQARIELLLPQLAVYASPYNVQKYTYLQFEDSEDLPSSMYVKKTMLSLGGTFVEVFMNINEPWELQAWHVRIAMRMRNIVVTDDSIEMPEEPITGPNLDYEQKFFYVGLTINKREKVRVRCLLHHVSADPKYKLINNSRDTIQEPPVAILQSQQEYLTELHEQRKIFEFSSEPQITPQQVKERIMGAVDAIHTNSDSPNTTQ